MLSVVHHVTTHWVTGEDILDAEASQDPPRILSISISAHPAADVSLDSGEVL